LIENDLFWQNRTFNIQVGGLGGGNLSQQNLVTLLPQLNQTFTGQCVTDTGHYWDIGVRGDTGPNNHATVTLHPTYSILTDISSYGGANNRSGNPNVLSQYCDGSRVPPENGGLGYIVPPGISDATVPNPIFNLMPAATVDEGNNWINMAYGPLALPNPTLTPGVAGYGNYGITTGSSAINAIPITALVNYAMAPTVDYFGTPRKNGFVDIGAVEFVAAPFFALNPTSLTFTAVLNGTSGPQTVTVNNTGDTSLTLAITLGGANPGQFAQTSTGCAPVAPGASCTINVTFHPTAANPNPKTATLNVNGGAGTTTQSVSLTGNVIVPSGTLTPNPVSFGNQLVGSTSAPTTVTFTNTSGGALTLRSGTAAGLGNANGPAVGFTGGNTTNFAAAGTTCANAAVIPTGGTCVINVTFTPNATGLRSSTLNIYATGATASFATDAVSGTGVQAAVTFSGSTALTTGTANRTVKNALTTITNSGTAPLVISTIAFTSTSGSNPGVFSVANPGTLGTTACPIGGTGLAAGAACQVTVTYTPPATGALNTITGTLTVTDTGAATPTQTRPYTGN
jgi:hypothetical protein